MTLHDQINENRCVTANAYIVEERKWGTMPMLNKLMETRAHDKIDIARQRSRRDHRVRYIVAMENGEYRITLRQPTIAHFRTDGHEIGEGSGEE